MSRRPGRGWAYACAQLGGVASVAANVAHSWVPPTTAAPNWQPPVGAVIASVFWPVALLVAIEAFARVAWPDGWRYTVLRFGGLLPVALVAAVVSYLHLSGLLASYHAGRFEVHVGPLAVDGLMVIGTAALIATSRSRPALVEARRVESVEALPEPPIPAADEATDEQVTETADPPNRGNGHDPVKVRRANALAALALGGEPDEIAADVGVTVQTLQRWVDSAAKQARRPPGRRREETTAGAAPAAN